MNAKKLLALLLTLVMLVGLIPAIPAIPAAAEEIVLEEEAAPTQELFTVVGGDFEPDAALFDEEPQPAAPSVDAAALPEARETDGAAEDGDALAPAETYDTPSTAAARSSSSPPPEARPRPSAQTRRTPTAYSSRDNPGKSRPLSCV